MLVWQTATRLHFNRDFRLNSQSLAACLTPTRALGGTAWPNFLIKDPRDETVTVLWANTTLGLILFWWTGTTQQAGRSRLSISRLPDLLALDTRALSTRQQHPRATRFRGIRGATVSAGERGIPRHESPSTRRGRSLQSAWAAVVDSRFARTAPQAVVQ